MKLNLQQRIAFPLLFALGVLLGISAFIVVHTIRSLKAEQIISESRSVLQKRAGEIETFLTDKARIPLTVFKSPFIQDWFSSYRQFRQPVSHDKGYQELIAYFRQLVASDSAIKSVYFATENTEEYFDQDGRFEAAGYRVKQRPWWQATLDKGHLYCDLSGIDYEDSTRAATMQMPVYRPDGRLLGVAGIDVSIETIESVLDGVRYKGFGEPFLIDENGHVIEFPPVEITLSWLERLDDLEGKIQDAKGLKSLARKMLDEGDGHTNLIWRGKKHIAVFTHVVVPTADVHWHLGLFLPEEILTTPVSRLTAAAVLVVVIVMSLILGFSFWITARTVKPLSLLASRLNQITHDECDLTVDIPVHSKDAIGQTTQNFNALLARLRELLRKVILNTRDVASSTQHLKDQSILMGREAVEMSAVTGQISDVSKRMVQTIESIAKAAENVAILAKQANEQVQVNEKTLTQRTQQMISMMNRLSEIQTEMDQLRGKSDNISDAVNIIDDISEQIGLLSINASIEAVKAGELGKGFTVVAEEIQKMSQNTQNANKNTNLLLGEFKNEFVLFQKYIQDINEKMAVEIQAFREMEKTFQSLLQGIYRTDTAAGRMQEQTQSQMKAIHEIKQSIDQIDEASAKISENITRSVKMIDVVDAKVSDLRQSTKVFKIETDKDIFN